ncbi:hypothetical protein [Sphingomonas sp. LHG3443-2]|uniref:hypothetical protein n=1 Tax=Sphingomonas sp. LHG3443-2 TaxID=2804639 RepID=UPI003CEB4CDC
MTPRFTKIALLSTASAAAAALFVPATASAQSNTTCTLRTGTTNVYDCLNGTTGVSTVTVTNGTFTGTAPLTFTTATGDLTVGAVAVSGGTITNTVNGLGNDAIRLRNTATGGAITLNATGQNVSALGTDVSAIDFAGNGGPITITAGNLNAPGLRSFGVFGTGGSVTNVTVGNITSGSTGADIGSTGNLTFTSGTINNSDGLALSLVSTGGTSTATTGAINSARGGVALQGTSVSFTGAGITARDFGIRAGSSTGGITIRSGAISSVGTGISTVATTGATDIGNCPTVATTTAGAPAIVSTSTTGNITINCGAITTAGDGSDGVNVSSTTGNVAVTTTTVNTGTGVDSDGVVIATGGTVNATTGALTTGGANSDGLQITGGTGAVTATVAGATTTGANSDAISITSAGPVTVTNSGTINVRGANSVGIDVATTGTGAVNVTTGVVTSTAPNTAADPSFAAVRVVAAGAAPVTVVANGNITTAAGSGIWAQTAGNTNVTVNSGVTVSGPTAITLGGAGTNTLVVNGTLTSTTAGTSGYVLAPGAGPLALTIGAAGSISGPLTFGAGNDVFSNSRTAGFTQSGALNFGAGNDTFNTSSIFTQNAAISFGDGNDTVNNTGVYNATGTTDFGAGTDTFNNGTTGTGAAAGTLTAFSGATFAGLEAFNNNAGLIDLRDGATGDILNLGTANYTATGNARLGIDVGSANGALTSDRLVYSGTTTGTTTILPTFLTGGPVIDTTGALVVDAGTVAAGQFVLGGPTNAGLINLALETRGSDVFLTGRPNVATGDLVLVNRLGRDIWHQSAEAYQAYAMSRRVDFGNERKNPVGIWAQLYGSKERFGDRNRTITAFGTNLTSSSRFETNRRGAQGGIEFGAPSFLIGATGGYEHAQGDSDFGTGIDLEGYNYGLYAQFGAQQGLYAGVLLKRDEFDVRVTNSGLGVLGAYPEGRSDGIDGEVGFRFGNPGGVNFDVGAGVSYVRSRLDDYNFGNLSFESDRYNSTRGRLQARASFAGAIAPFIDGKIFREFGDAADLTVRSGTLSSNLVDEKRGTWGRIEAGIGGGAGGGPLLSAFVDLGDVRGWGLRGGFRF